MMKIYIYFTLISILVFTSCQQLQNTQKKNTPYIDYIDTFIGTVRDGNQLPGPKCPFGMIHPNVINIGESTPESTNYKFGEPEIFGIALTNMVGVGCANFGSITLKPTTGNVDFRSYKISTTYTNHIC